jgi:hypothetical protein
LGVLTIPRGLILIETALLIFLTLASWYMNGRDSTIAGFLLLALFVPHGAHAAAAVFEAQREQVQIGETFAVRVLLATDQRSINAVEGTIQFSKESLELREIRDGGSLVNLWMRKPTLHSGAVSFSGVIPGGYAGDAGYLFTLVFRARQAGRSVVQSSDERFVLNDGRGTLAPLRRVPLTVRVGEGVSDTDFAAIHDATSPEAFTLAAARSQYMFDGKWFATFITDDKGVGLDYYEVAESRGLFRPKTVHWASAQSPYVLQDQELQSWIFVKAVDKAGNERLAVLEPTHRPLRWFLSAVGILALTFFVIFILRFLGRRRNSSRRQGRYGDK